MTTNLPVIDDKQNTLALNEHFLSFQGEGSSAGKPAYFIRLNGCDLKCSFCDTPQTWKKGKLEPSVPMTAEEIVDIVLDRVRNHPGSTDSCSRVVITGGEPLLQQRRPAFRRLLFLLRSHNFSVEIETAGHHAPEKFAYDLVDQWNISPKLETSGNKFLDYPMSLKYFHPYLRPEPTHIIGGSWKVNSYLKFVVGISDDYDGEFALIDKLVEETRWPNDRIIVMPEGVTIEAVTSKMLPIVERAIQRCYTVGTRMHILVWGDKRGV